MGSQGVPSEAQSVTYPGSNSLSCAHCQFSWIRTAAGLPDLKPCQSTKFVASTPPAYPQGMAHLWQAKTLAKAYWPRPWPTAVANLLAQRWPWPRRSHGHCAGRSWPRSWPILTNVWVNACSSLDQDLGHWLGQGLAR